MDSASVKLSDLLPVSVAAKRTPLTEGQLRGWIARGYVKSIRWGGRVFVTADELRRVLQSQYREPAE